MRTLEEGSVNHLSRPVGGRRLSRALLLLAAVMAALLLPGCYPVTPDLISTLKGRCEGNWVVLESDRPRLPAGEVPRDRLSISIDTRAPLGDALVPGESYARGTLAWGDRSSPFVLEYPLGSRGMGCAQVRYMHRDVAPFGLPDSGGFNLLLLTGGGRNDDLLCVEFQREAPVAGGTEHMLRFARAWNDE